MTRQFMAQVFELSKAQILPDPKNAFQAGGHGAVRVGTR
jgi:hypothetical protein